MNNNSLEFKSIKRIDGGDSCWSARDTVNSTDHNQIFYTILGTPTGRFNIYLGSDHEYEGKFLSSTDDLDSAKRIALNHAVEAFNEKLAKCGASTRKTSDLLSAVDACLWRKSNG